MDDRSAATPALCSGTVVSSNVVLTAGHCAENTETGIVDASAGYQVSTGTRSLATPGQLGGVTRVIPYPAFDPTTLARDAALLILATPTTVAPVTLASEPTDAYLYDDETGTAITGWGVDDSTNPRPDHAEGVDPRRGQPVAHHDQRRRIWLQAPMQPAPRMAFHITPGLEWNRPRAGHGVQRPLPRPDRNPVPARRRQGGERSAHLGCADRSHSTSRARPGSTCR